MVNVNVFKNFVEAVQNKVQSGNSITPLQFNSFAHQSQMLVFEKDRKTFLKTQESSDFLDNFLKTKTLNPSSLTGFAPYPDDFQHTAGVRAYYNGIERPVDLVTNKAWGEIQASELQPATRYFPKYTEFAGEYRFLHRNIGIVMLDYWKEPVKPVWGWTSVNNAPAYNPVTSTDFEWEAFSLNEVASVYLSLIGCNIKDKELEQFSGQFAQQNNNIL